MLNRLPTNPEPLYFGHCALCERSVWNPCQSAQEDSDPPPVPHPSPPFDVSKPIKAKSKAALLTRVMECSIGRMIHRLGLSRPEVRCYVHYRLEQGSAAGATYAWANGVPMLITPQMIEEAFDGRRQQRLSADLSNWGDEKEIYDRAISDLVKRAVAGEIKSKPDHRWYLRFMLIDLARRTPIFDMPDDDGAFRAIQSL